MKKHGVVLDSTAYNETYQGLAAYGKAHEMYLSFDLYMKIPDLKRLVNQNDIDTKAYSEMEKKMSALEESLASKALEVKERREFLTGYLRYHDEPKLLSRLLEEEEKLRRYEREMNNLKRSFERATDRYQTDLGRSKSRKESMLNIYKSKIEELSLSPEQVIIHDNFLLVIEKPYFINQTIKLRLLSIELPYSRSEINSANIYANGSNLGSSIDHSITDKGPRRKARPGSFSIYKSSPEVAETNHEYTFNAEGLTSSGRVSIFINGSSSNTIDAGYGDDFDFELTLEYRDRSEAFAGLASTIGEEKPEETIGSIGGNITTISGIREGSHLSIPLLLRGDKGTKEINLILDTGASITTISRQDYYEVSKVPLTRLESMSFETANGLIQTPVGILQASTSGISKDIQVAISNRDIGLLGMNFLKDYIFAIDLENASIYVLTQ